MAPTVQNSEWKALAEQASVEMDGDKLQTLVLKLCAALDAREEPKPPLLFSLPVIYVKTVQAAPSKSL